MKKQIMKASAALLLVATAFAFTFSASANVAVGNKDCDKYCESSREYHCKLTYSDGSQVLCLNMAVKGTHTDVGDK